MQCVPGFVLSPQTRHSTPPNQVRYPTDRQFVSGCSPPCLTATQLPSTTRSWLASTRTSTALMRCPLGRTDSGLRRSDESGVSQHRENHREKLCACNLPRLKDIVVPAEAGIQAKSGAPGAQRTIG